MPKQPQLSNQDTSPQTPIGLEAGFLGTSHLTAPDFLSRIAFTFGRGTRGKSFWARWAIDRALDAGRNPVIGDFDRQNQSLRSFYGDQRCTVPANAEDAGIEDCLRGTIERVMEQPTTGIIDFGAGDTVLRRVSRRLGGLVPFLEENRVGCTAIHVFGPSLDDLAILKELEPQPDSRDEVERLGVFAPRATILVLNSALVPQGNLPEQIYRPLTEHPVFRAAVERGAVPIFMPRLQVATEVESKRLGFIAAETGHPGPDGTRIGPWHAREIRTWRNTMENNHRSVLGWLP